MDEIGKVKERLENGGLAFPARFTSTQLQHFQLISTQQSAGFSIYEFIVDGCNDNHQRWGWYLLLCQTGVIIGMKSAL